MKLLRDMYSILLPNKINYYQKHELVSSHICTILATNLFGSANHVIQAVGGWATEQMMLHYIKKI
jgi:hypothetical protein